MCACVGYGDNHGYGDKGTIKTRTVKEERQQWQGFCSDCQTDWHGKDGQMVRTEREKKCIERQDSLPHLRSNGAAGQSSPAITFRLRSAKVRGEAAELREGMNVRIQETEREGEREREGGERREGACVVNLVCGRWGRSLD